jgi:hypothetical protein
VTLALLILAAAGASAQTGVVEGRVVNGATGDSVRRAAVSVRRPGEIYTVETNSSGAFRVDGLTAGPFTLSVSRAGYLPAGGREFEIGYEARISGIVVSLTPVAVISGRVVDADGDPISGATVRAVAYAYVEGRRQLRMARSTTSDDRGQYRLFDLTPGRYFIQASRAGGSPGGRVFGYHPAASDLARAAAVDAAPGVEARGTDVLARASGLYTVRARILDANGPVRFRFPPGPGADVPIVMAMLTPQSIEERPAGFSMRGEVWEATDVPPGRYVFTARMGNRTGTAALFARRDVEVSGSDVEFSVTVAPLFPVRGNLIGISDAAAATVRIEAEGNTRMSGKPLADGSFELKNVPPDTYFVRVAAEGFYLQSVRLGERLLDSQKVDLAAGSLPLTIRLADDGAEVAGLVLDTEERPVGGATVVLEPAVADWPDRLKMLVADANGNFRIHDVAPGDYRLLAWRGPDPDESTAVKIRATADGEHRITVRVR